jgi:hypothetical protein
MHLAPDDLHHAADLLDLGDAGRFRSVLQNMSEGLMLFDAERNLVYQNPASLRIHGFDPGGDGRIARDRLAVTWEAWDDRGRPIAFDEWPSSPPARSAPSTSTSRAPPSGRSASRRCSCRSAARTARSRPSWRSRAT